MTQTTDARRDDLTAATTAPLSASTAGRAPAEIAQNRRIVPTERVRHTSGWRGTVIAGPIGSNDVVEVITETWATKLVPSSELTVIGATS